MKQVFFLLFFASSAGAQTDTFFVESNLLYVVKSSVKKMIECNKSDVYSVAEMQVDSILYFEDSLVMKNHDFFKKNAKYLFFDPNKFSLMQDSTYYLSIFLGYKYSVFGIKQISAVPVIVHENKTYGFNIDYPLGPDFYYERRKLKEFFHVAIFGRKSYSRLPKSKTHRIKKHKKPKFLDCVEDI